MLRVCVQVLKYSQADVSRMRKEFELDMQARFLAKEREWCQKDSAMAEDSEKLRKANEEMK